MLTHRGKESQWAHRHEEGAGPPSHLPQETITEHIYPHRHTSMYYTHLRITLDPPGLDPGTNALVIANNLFQEHKRRLYTWTSPDGQHRNQINYILCSQRWRSSIQSTKTRPGADCGSDHELLIMKFRLKLKKEGKTTRPLRYDLNQIPYNYTVELTNLIDSKD